MSSMPDAQMKSVPFCAQHRIGVLQYLLVPDQPFFQIRPRFRRNRLKKVRLPNRPHGTPLLLVRLQIRTLEIALDLIQFLQPFRDPFPTRRPVPQIFDQRQSSKEDAEEDHKTHEQTEDPHLVRLMLKTRFQLRIEFAHAGPADLPRLPFLRDQGSLPLPTGPVFLLVCHLFSPVPLIWANIAPFP